MLELSTLKEFRNDYYHPANFVLSVCGDLDEKEFFRTAEELFSHGEKRPKTLKPHHQQNHDFAYQIENRINIAQLHLKIDYHGFSTGNKDKYATFLLARLFKYKLNQLLLAAFTSTKLAPYILDVASFSSHSYGLFGLYTSIKPQDLPNFLLLYRITIAKILSGNFSQKDLKYLKNKINADFEYTFEKTSLRADFYSELFLYDQLTDSHGKELQKHLAVNINDLNKVAKKIFSQKPKITIVDKELTNNEFVTIWNKSSALI
jgi:predicted Zn-dependent peptidase